MATNVGLGTLILTSLTGWARGAAAQEGGPGLNFDAQLAVTGFIENARMGTSVALDGDHAAVGAPGGGGGAVYLLHKVAGGWEVESKIIPQDSHPGQLFGSAVAMRGNLLAIGAAADDERAFRGGAVYLYTRSGASQPWEFHRKLFPTTPELEGNFGKALAYDGTWLVIGAPGENSTAIDAGKVYVFLRLNTPWQLFLELVPPGTYSNQAFGASLDVDGGIVAVGSPGNHDGVGDGAVLVYRFEAGNPQWGEATETLYAPGSGNMGHSVDLCAPWLAVGAPHATTGGGTVKGTAYLYRDLGGTYSAPVLFRGLDEGDEQGTAVALSLAPGDEYPRLLVGAARNSSSATQDGVVRSYDHGDTSGWGLSQTYEDPQGGNTALLGGALAANTDDFLAGSRHAVSGTRRTGAVLGFERSAEGWLGTGRVSPSDGGPLDRLGHAVAVAGDLAVVGAPWNSDNVYRAGAAYVYERENGVWSMTARLNAGNHVQNGASFGSSVATDGEVIVIGAPGEDGPTVDTGAVYAFGRSFIGTWSSLGSFRPQDPALHERFGASVAISGDLYLTGAPGAKPAGLRTGAVYAYTRSSIGFWSLQGLISDPRVGESDDFGQSIALDGNLLAVGSPRTQVEGTRVGAVFLFEHDDTQWSDGDMLLGDGTPSGRFGEQVLLAEERLAVSAVGTDGMYGSVRLYAPDGDEWNLTRQFDTPQAGTEDGYGAELALSNGVLAIAAPYHNYGDDFIGAVHLYKSIGDLWEESTIMLPTAQHQDRFGSAIGLDGDLLVVGASGLGESQTGGAFAYTIGQPNHLQSFGFGDGSIRPCPCGNDSAPGARQGCVNSTGEGASLRGYGSASLEADDLVLYAHDLPPGKSTQLFIGINRLVGVAFGDGLRIATVPFIRIPLQQSSSSGEVTWYDLNDTGFWSAGDTRYFQAFYRDPAGPCGSGFNVTSAVQAVFLP